MRLLLIHADQLDYEVQKPALSSPPPVPPGAEKGSVSEALVVFFSVEREDASSISEVVDSAGREILSVREQVRAPRVVLYPYAHLSSQLAPPEAARKVGDELRRRCEEILGVPVLGVPFGYYKSFTLRAKGHPLAELSRQISPRTGLEGRRGEPPLAESEALIREKGLRSQWYILTPDGDLVEASQWDFSQDADFRAFYEYETKGSRQAGEEPPHVRLMRELELVDYEPGSDAGNFRWYPKGFLVKRLLQDRASSLVESLGGMRVETPLMYDYEHPGLKKYLDRFPARQYVLRSEDKEYFLRFAACFGQYLIFHDMVIGRDDLPVRLYELAQYAFRREQSGELSGLRRLRTFTMPDMHILVADGAQAEEEAFRQFEGARHWMADLGVPYHMAIRFVRNFFEEHRDFCRRLARAFGRPMLLEMWEERSFYFVMKLEFHPLDTQGRAAALSTVQIDVENAERFEIQYTDRDGRRKTPLILHASIPGGIERNLYALLETEARRIARGGKGRFPFWLAPTQVRILPVGEPHVAEAERLATELERTTGVRVDVDDRDEGVSRKIRDAEKEWVPMTIVYGDREAHGGPFSVRLREGEPLSTDLEGFRQLLRRELGDYPRAPLPVPRRLSRRPIFRR